MQKIGIWLDLNQAKIVQLKNNNVEYSKIDSNIDHSKVKGGSRSKDPWGPVITVSESKHLAKREQELKDYFENIIDVLKSSDEYFLMGPAETKIRLKKYIAPHQNLFDKMLDVQTADKMTNNQLIAKVKDFFAVTKED